MRLPDGRVFRDSKLKIKVSRHLLAEMLGRKGSDLTEQDSDVTIPVLKLLHAIHERVKAPEFTRQKIAYSAASDDVWVSAEMSGLMNYWMHEACVEYKLSPGRIIRFAVYEATFGE